MLDAKDRKAWEDLGRCEMTVKLVLHNLQYAAKRFDENTDSSIVYQVRDAINQCETCLRECGSQPL